MVAIMATAMTRPSVRIVKEVRCPESDDGRPKHAVKGRNDKLAIQHPEHIAPTQLTGGLAANDQGQGLGASDAAHARHNGHEYCKGYHLHDGVFKQADNRGCHQCGDEIDAQPDSPAAHGSADWCEGVFINDQTGWRQEQLLPRLR